MEREPTEQHKTSGLDMKETLEWYRQSKPEIPPIQETTFPYPIEKKKLIELSDKELGGLLSLFPENARRRSILRKVVGQPITWFHRDSTGKKQIPTTNPADALSPTAIIPSYANTEPWTRQVPAADVWLYQIPQNAVPEEDIRRLVLAQGFIHEVGHTIIYPSLYIKDNTLKFPDGKIINGLEAVLHFAELAEQHPPISQYASTFRGDNNKFESSDPEYDVKVAINEELAETIAAHLCGFAYCSDDVRGKNPFADRPEIKAFVRNFLNAELIS
jgi:hypothetical protein